MLTFLFKRAAYYVVVALIGFVAHLHSHAEESPYPLLTNLTQIRQLPQVEARKGYPVEFKAIVTCFEPSFSAVVFEVGDEAIYARYPAGETMIKPGDEVILKGFTLAGEHNYLAASSITIVSKRNPLPTPLVLEGERLFDVNLDCRRATATGTVEWVKVDGSKWVFSIRQNGRQFFAQLVRPPRTALDPREWVGARVQFTGPASIRRVQSEGPVTRVFCPTIADVRVVQSPPEPQPVKIRDLDKWVQADQWLSVTGHVSAIAPIITIKDDTGELPLPAVPFARTGDEIEITGFAVSTNGVVSLGAADARIIERDEKGQRRRLVTSIAQVRGLSRAEAEKRLPVRLRGVVTYSEGPSKFFFIHDGANGIFIWPENPLPDVRVGSETEVVGNTSPGMFAPIVNATRITLGRRTELPAAKPVTLSDLLSGREDSTLVEIAGVVRHVYPKDGRIELEIATAAGKLTARVLCALESAQMLEHASVRVSGIASGHFNERRQIVAALLFVPDLDSIRVEEKPAADPFSVKHTRLHDVFGYRADADLTPRALVSGIVAWQAPQGGLYLVDGDESLFVEAAPLPNLAPGSKVEAVGYPALGARFAPILQDAVARVVGVGAPPEPRLADSDALRNGDLDGRLVKVCARFIEGYDQAGLSKSTWKSEDGNSLIFDALLAGKHPIELKRDTVAELTGVVRTLMNDERKPAGLELYLRGPADVAVLSKPGFWTAARMWRIVVLLVVVLAVSFGWVVFLRRKVEEQTGLVKRQLAKEEELQRQYRGLFDNNPHPMWVFDPKTLKFLAVNETAVQRYGYSREEFLSMLATDIRPLEERERLREFVKTKEAMAQDAAIWQHQRKDGSRMFVEATTRRLSFAGEEAILVLAHDITERLRTEKALRLSEAKFRSMVESSLIGIVFFDANGVITDTNDCFLSMVGRTREEVRNGALKAVDFAPPDRVERHEKAMEYLRTHGMAPASRREFLRRDGVRAPAMVGAVALDGTDSYVAFVLDLTKENALEQQVVLAQKMEAVGLLAGGVAHDFNNLLQVIEGYTLLSLEMLDANAGELRENLQSVQSAAERAAELTRQLLVFSRQENLKEAQINVAETMGETLKLVRRVIGEHIEVKFTTAPDLVRIRADKGRIEQVLMNLCVNARDAMPKGGVLTIDLSNATLMEGEGAPVGQVGGRFVCLRVTDTGGGMDSATLARIYEPFFTTKSKDQGSGLGLSIVYGIVERHKGVIRVHSKVGAGTTFVVYFPASISYDTQLILKNPEIADKGGMETILLVEDEPAVRMLAARVLKRAGYDVRVAADGAEACDVFKEHGLEIDLVLMDVIMPKMGGRDAYENIVKTRSDIPVIFCSGYSERELGAEFLESHSLDLLPKPYRPDELLTRIRARLHPEQQQS